MTPSPVALFVYNRPDHTKRLLESLKSNKQIAESKLFVFADGVKKGASETEQQAIEEVRSLIKEIDFAADLHLEMHEMNKGLANSIEYGVTYVLSKHESVIVIEDDLILGKEFLKFMNEALVKYADEKKIMHVSAYMPPLKGSFSDVALIALTHSWGWGTWKKSWLHFNSNADVLLNKIKKQDLIHRFNYDGTFRFYKMLERTSKGSRDSWAIKWYASIFVQGGLALNTTKSLLRNIGHDSSGTHSFKTRSFDSKMNEEPLDISIQDLDEHQGVREAMRSFFIRQKFTDGPSYYWQKLKSKFRK